MNIKQYVLSLTLIITPLFCSGQNSHTINGGSGTLIIHEINKVTIVGTNDSNVKMEIEGGMNALPEKAKGLKLINPSGIIDNTGIGLSVESDGNTHTVQAVSNKGGKRYVFHVPKGYLVQYESNSNNGGKFIVENCESELDVSVRYNSVWLSGVTGPLAVHSVYGSINAQFNSVHQEGPSSLYSVYAEVDLTIPSNSPVDFQLRAEHGNVYSDLNLEYPKDEKGMTNLSSKEFVAKTNGGGVSFKVKSGYSNVYLRAK